jgi:hypothetical protein
MVSFLDSVCYVFVLVRGRNITQYFRIRARCAIQIAMPQDFLIRS